MCTEQVRSIVYNSGNSNVRERESEEEEDMQATHVSLSTHTRFYSCTSTPTYVHPHIVMHAPRVKKLTEEATTNPETNRQTSRL